METIASPVPNPASLAFSPSALWIASAKTLRVYETDPKSLHVSRELVPPGEPFGLAFGKDGLLAVLGFGDDGDDRYVYGLADETFEERFACPDMSGAYFTIDKSTINLTHANDKRFLTLSDTGDVRHSVDLKRRPVGVAVVKDAIYLVTADEEWKNREFARIDPKSGELTTLLQFPFMARGLAHDGERFWTTHREASELVRF